jgi:hypothetical protein
MALPNPDDLDPIQAMPHDDALESTLAKPEKVDLEGLPSRVAQRADGISQVKVALALVVVVLFMLLAVVGVALLAWALWPV